MGREWFEAVFLPVLHNHNKLKTEDYLATIYEHIAIQITHQLENKGRMLITGGGAHNTYLLSKIREKTAVECHVPEKQLIDYKEALVFAFLGLLKLHDEPNCYSSVTGAIKNSKTGVKHTPNR